ncbi:MAG: hypothetical protein DHS20C11_10150 [Lysobacteraceae bacterium]|nr:MAG: hypothetical protein DHS20C11_10150 [Xanthomonadaceae bacterium]
MMAVAGVAVAEDKHAVEFGKALRHDVSPPLAELLQMGQKSQIERPSIDAAREIPNILPAQNATQNVIEAEHGGRPSPISRGAGAAAPPLGESFDGIGATGVLPPDTNGDVNDSYYVQYINLDWRVYNKDGTPHSAQMNGNTFWAGFGGPCQVNNSGDPIVLWDDLAQVWVFSQFTGSAQPRQCFAVTDSVDPSDPAAVFNRYEFDFSPEFNDYPHIGIWTDASGTRSGYYFVTHDFGASFLGASFSVVERDAMIAGDPAAFVRFPGFDAYGALPPHLIGTEVPEAGTCAPFVHHEFFGSGYRFWDMCVNWGDPTLSYLTDEHIVDGGVAYSGSLPGIEQPAFAATLDSFGSNTMYRATARAFNGEGPSDVSLVINHSVNVGSGQAGVRWVHFDIPGGDELFIDTFGPDAVVLAEKRVIDSGIFAPDSDSRWMGGIAIDQGGNIGLGYSVGSATQDPELRYTGKAFYDPSGEMRSEDLCVLGGGSQASSSGRWGDYASMSVDPADQCTFWFTSEYYATDGNASWRTRICSFTFPDCGTPTFALQPGDGTRREVCGATDSDPSWTVQAVTIGGYNAGVNFSATTPGGTSGSFSVNPLPATPGETVMTLTGGAALASGEYGLEVSGDSTSGPATNRTIPFTLGVSDTATAAVSLVAPANASTGQSIRPSFDWNPIAGALTYRLEVATDAGFTNIVASVETEDTEALSPISLDETTQYFWRVVGANYCGDGTFSSTFSFTTGELGSCPGPVNTLFSDDLESGDGNWNVTNNGGNPWTLIAAPGGTGLTGMAYYAEDTASTSDKYLDSIDIALPVGESPLTLAFNTYRDIEPDSANSCWDGGLLEISTDGGSNWTQVPDSMMLNDPYTGLIVTNDDSPISDLPAWCGANVGPIQAFVALDDWAGDTVRFRFRMGTDGAVGLPDYDGWYVDDIEVQGCQ